MVVTEWAVCCFVLGAFAFSAGAAIGVWSERRAWLARAMPPNQTPHCAGGRFYYVIEESCFCREFATRQPAGEE